MEQTNTTTEVVDIDNPFVDPIVGEDAASDVENAISHDQNSIPYSPMSKLPSMGTVIPLNLAGETMQAQFAFKEEIPDVDEYLVQKLGYSSKLALSQAIGAEQADAVALAIRQIEKDKGFIVADMAGIGKGRVGASILRYAKVNGYLPIFITEAPNLFTAMYRDIWDIGGIETKGGGERFMGTPFILNGYQTGGYELDEEGKKVEKPSKTAILSPITGKVIMDAPEQKIIAKTIESGSFPKKFDYLMLTYSQLSQGKAASNKVDWMLSVIEKMGGKAILVMDECHNATGTTSSVGLAIQSLLTAVKGVTFVSATFSKRPDNMYIYALKTDIVDSPLGTKKLLQAIVRGGDKLTENLASNLVASQQMIRRERTFDNCDVDYQYMSDDEKTELFQKYDNTIQLYYRLRDFFSMQNPLFKDAKKAALDKFTKAHPKYEIVTEEIPDDAKEKERWRKRHEGKFRIASFTAGEIKRSQFNFIETLLFALKADFVANATLKQMLNNKLENVSTKDKSIFLSNRKPVIAVRNTLESIFKNLKIDVGEEIPKADFSMYVLSLALEALHGTITLRQIREKGKAKELKEDFSILTTDFTDYGKRYNEIVEEIRGINLNIPLSPIDYVIDKIQNTPRPAWDMQYGNGSEKFKVVEVTGRSLRLTKTKTGYKLIKNPKPKSVSDAFKSFNNGSYDVILINEAGSTGEDAHSKSTFKDTRPRVMIIHQVELNVNTEVQKRGRINRTGQVSFPSYVYAVSRIPSEIRRLLMLVRKLRSLDANTTGNQKQSAKLSQIKDSFGNQIQDIINKYGDTCLQTFLSVSENSEYLQFLPTDSQQKLKKLSGDTDSGGGIIEDFVRNLEVSLSKTQEDFYNVINQEYKNYTDELIDDGRFDLETSIVNWKASLKSRTIIEKGLNTSPFNTSVYEEDDYILDEAKPYNKAKVADLVRELAKNQDPTEFYLEFLNDYKKNFIEEKLPNTKAEVSEPDYSLAKDDIQKKDMEDEYKERIKSAVNKAIDEYNSILQVFYKVKKGGDGLPILDKEGYVITTDLAMKPDGARLIPADTEECFMTDEDGFPFVPKDVNNAKFCGVKILNTAKEKYSPMNIELSFCQLAGKPKLLLKPTSRGREILQWINVKSEYIDRYRIVAIDNWDVDPNLRTIARLYTGNILGAYGIAVDAVRKDNNYSPVIKFVKFTTVDEDSIRLGIHLTMKKYSPLIPSKTPVSYALNSKDLLSAVENTSNSYVQSINGDENFQFRYSSKQKNGIIEIFGGRATEPNPKKYLSKIYSDGEFKKLLDRTGLFYIRNSSFYYKPINSERSITLKVLQINVTDLTANKKSIESLFEYIYSKDPFNLGIIGGEQEEMIGAVIPLKDPYPEMIMKEIVVEEAGKEYKYALSTPYKYVEDNLLKFPKFLRYDSGTDTIILSGRANVREAIQYDLTPLDTSVKNMVADTFQLLSDNEKIKFQDELKNGVKAGIDDFDLGRIAEKLLLKKVVTWKPIFGYGWDDFEFVGQVFRSYIKGDIEMPIKKVVKKEYIIEKKPLNIDTAQEFLIYLTFKVNN